jgi:phospholipid/cholesterol/gamma-HCH transport system substrate-binding protein
MTRRVAVNLAALLVFSVFCIGGLGYLAMGMGLEVPIAQQGWRLQADFAQADGLVPQADVDVSGIKVGKVVSVESDGHNGALATMRIDGQVHLRQDVRAYVRPKSLIGEKYVELIRTPRSNAAVVGDGFRIARANTGQAIEIDTILNALDPQTRAALSSSLRELGVAVNGQAANINQSIPGVDQATANLRPLAQVADRRQQELDRILVDLAIIMQALADEQDALGRVVDSGNTALGAIASRDNQLAGTVQQANTLMISLDSIFKDLTPADRASLQKAPPTIQSGSALLSQLNPTVDRLLPELLLAQINYPNNQLNVSSSDAVSLAQEWLSAFSQRDSSGHAFRITPILDPGNAVKLPQVTAPPSGRASPPASQPQAPPAAPGVETQDASGGLIPAVVQLLLGTS